MFRGIFLFLFSTLLIAPSVIAGERGYYLFAWGNKSGKEYMTNYANSDAYKSSKSCWDKRSGNSIAVLYLTVYPAGITDELVNSFLAGNNDAMPKIRKSLLDFGGDSISSSYVDGMIIVKKQGNNIEIGTVPVKGSNYLYKRRFVVNNNDYRSFDKQLCQALAPIDKYFSP
ncbi:hypothetical protein C9426_16170 [Serratia sp. S1B]|nr:hypothetical protein C9426_16170 [Serratia sp. S1B]